MVNIFQHCGCFDLLSSVNDKSVDLLLTDPPYCISKDSGFGAGKLRKFTVYKTDFGNWDHKIIDLPRFAGEIKRVLKKDSFGIIWYDIWKMESLKSVFETAGFSKFRLIQWNKTNPVPINSSTNYLSNAFEYALVFKNGNGTFNSKYDKGCYQYPICHGKERKNHPTQKPLALAKDLILKHSKVDELILDPFGGSGTFALAAKETNRNFLSCDISEEYVKIAKERLSCSKITPALLI